MEQVLINSMASKSTPKSSAKTSSPGSSSITDTELPFPYLNEYHRLRSEEAIEAHSKQPWMSREEAYAQYDRLKAGRAEHEKASEKPSSNGNSANS
jgi:hypothetical protein